VVRSEAKQTPQNRANTIDLAQAEIGQAARLFQRDSTPSTEAGLICLERAEALLNRDRVGATPPTKSEFYQHHTGQCDAVHAVVLAEIVDECIRREVANIGYEDLCVLIITDRLKQWLEQLEIAELIVCTSRSDPSSWRIAPTISGQEWLRQQIARDKLALPPIGNERLAQQSLDNCKTISEGKRHQGSEYGQDTAPYYWYHPDTPRTGEEQSLGIAFQARGHRFVVMARCDGDIYYAHHDTMDGNGHSLTREDELFFGGAVWLEMSRDPELARVVLGHSAIRELFGFGKYLDNGAR
jgi:hypothetical protein